MNLSVMHIRYTGDPYTVFAREIKDNSPSLPIETAPTNGDLVFFVYLLYSVPVGPYLFANQYFPHSVHATKEEAEAAKGKLFQDGTVPEQAVSGGIASPLDTVYIFEATFTDTPAIIAEAETPYDLLPPAGARTARNERRSSYRPVQTPQVYLGSAPTRTTKPSGRRK